MISKSNRTEIEIFNDLERLCSCSGYAHVIAHLCFKNNLTKYTGDITTDDLDHIYSSDYLIRNELAILIGLLVKNTIDYLHPTAASMEVMIKETQKLLQELHDLMSSTIFQNIFNEDTLNNKKNPFKDAMSLREAIFYGSESAYNFQYRDFSKLKYKKDDAWFISNKGYSVEQAHSVIIAIEKLQVDKALSTIESLEITPLHKWTLLPAFQFSIDDIYKYIKVDKKTIYNILASFTVPSSSNNKEYNSIDDFNITNAYPLISIDNNTYLLFQNYSLVEAFYETPFFWFNEDKQYKNTAMINRGHFTEKLSEDRLQLVFGKDNVYSNIDIIDSKGNKAGEIDVLVVYANRAIILQAKSKKLTLKARKGNNFNLNDDFKKAIQDSYNQGYSCANLIENINYNLIDSTGHEISITRKFKEIYIFCIVSDHYPALSFQSQQLLEFQQTENILPPFIMDVFLLDVMTEMLQAPLYFLSYINKRSLYNNRVSISHELTTLSYHLKQNLWIADDLSMLMLHDDIAHDLDIAMMARRQGISGNKTPKGILTLHTGTVVGNIIKNIENIEDTEIIDFGFLLLTLSSDALDLFNKNINKIINLTKIDGNHHDFMFSIDEGKTGITIHCNYYDIEMAKSLLHERCEMRKYKHKAASWFGISIDPITASIKFGTTLNFQWEKTKKMEVKVKDLSIEPTKQLNARVIKKIGRNDSCPCGSNKKYKKCCLKNNTSLNQ